MPTQIAQTINLNDTSVLRETDRFLANLVPELEPFYGKSPIIFWKYDTTNPKKWVKEQSANYIAYAGSGVRRGFASHVNIGSEDSPSKFCGKSYTNTTSLYDDVNHRNISGAAAPKYIGNETPVFKRRGVIIESVPGMEDEPYVFTKNKETMLSWNASRQEVMTAFITYLQEARRSGADNASTKAKTLSCAGRGEKGGDRAITTYAQLAQAFPRYFTFERQFEKEAEAALASGFNPQGWKIYVDGQWWDVQTTYVGLWEQFVNKGLSDGNIVRELLAMGYTMEQIHAVRAIKGLTYEQLKRLPQGTTGGGGGGGGGSGGGGSSSGGGRAPGGTKWTGPEGYVTGRIQEITVQRSKNIFFTADESRRILGGKGISIDNSKPIMYQIYRGSEAEQSLVDDFVAGEALINQYVFDIVPLEINYGGFGGEWVSIDRAGSFPYIDWKSFKLLQISFQFEIAVRNGPATADGLDLPVTAQIEKLQRMAQTPYPIMFYGFDTLLTNQFRYDETGTPRGVQFVIQDLSISAIRRNAKMEITRAKANITFQEIPVERTSLIGMPRLKHTNKPPEEPPPFTDPEYGLASDSLTSRPDSQINYNQATVGG